MEDKKPYLAPEMEITEFRIKDAMILLTSTVDLCPGPAMSH